MFSLIQKILKAAQSLSVVSERLTHLESCIGKIETKLTRFEKLADENESLWQFLDEQKEIADLFAGNVDAASEEFTDAVLRNLKPYGDA